MKRFTIKEKNIVFYNQFIDKNTMKQLISRLVVYLGSECTAYILDQIKSLGFKNATCSGISLGIDDLLTTPSKIWILKDSEYQIYTSEQQYLVGSIHAVERLRHVVETWHTTSEYLKRLMYPHFKTIDPLNPIHIMSFSGARGSTSQVHQLIGMRGLMANPQGNIIDLPIQTNFREGLSLTEYIISCYGARKGVVDTAVRTADAGYLTRRLVEVCQQVIVNKYDCFTSNGIHLNNIKDSQNLTFLLSFQDRLIGRILAQNIIIQGRCIARKNQDIGPSLANSLSVLKYNEIFIRSPLTCESMPNICQLCYGWDLSYANLVEIGTAIGIIAGQSIGEPGTQLTLRTFHTGGVFTGDVAEHVRAPYNGIIQFDANNLQATRNRHGRLAFVCMQPLSLIIINELNQKNVIIIPKYSLLMVTNSQRVKSKQVIAEIRASIMPMKQTVQKDVFSHTQGEIFYKYTSLSYFAINYRRFIELDSSDILFKSLLYLGFSKDNFNSFIEKADYVWILSSKLHLLKKSHLLNFFHKTKDYIQKKILIAKVIYTKKKIHSILNLFYKKKYIFFNIHLINNHIISNYSGSITNINKNKKCILILSSLDQFKIDSISKTNYPYKYIQNSLFSSPMKIKKRKNYGKSKKINLYSYNIYQSKIEYFYHKYIGFIGTYFDKSKFDSFRLVLSKILKTNKTDSNKTNLLSNRYYHIYIDDNKKINFILQFKKNFLLFNYLLNFYDNIHEKKNNFIIGQFIFKNALNIDYSTFQDSGQILCLSANSLTLCSAKPYLVTKDTKIFHFHRDIVQEGQRLLTFLYERLKASDIIQGLPKAEQLLEARLGNKTISILDTRFQYLIQDFKKKIGNKVLSLIEMDFFLSKLSIQNALEALHDSQLEILNEIQNVYLSQGVFIADKHIEIVIRQMTFKTIIIENADFYSLSPKGIIRNIFLFQGANTYLPGELLDLYKARKLNDILSTPISCKPILLGITKASLNTNSFLSEASFERTITVLSKAAIKGRNDWLNGLKENVLFSNLIPVGTGSYRIALEVVKYTKQSSSYVKQDKVFSIYSFNHQFIDFHIFLNNIMIENKKRYNNLSQKIINKRSKYFRK